MKGFPIGKSLQLFQIPYDKNVIVSPAPEGLSDESVQELKELAKSGSFEAFGGTLAIQHSVHFAPSNS